MRIQKDKDIYVISHNRQKFYCETYEKGLYYAAFILVGDTNPYESIESFHRALKIALNKEFQGNLGDKIDFTGQWWYPSAKYCDKKQPKVKYLELT